jgi:hypothetical protein
MTSIDIVPATRRNSITNSMKIFFTAPSISVLAICAWLRLRDVITITEMSFVRVEVSLLFIASANRGSDVPASTFGKVKSCDGRHAVV